MKPWPLRVQLDDDQLARLRDRIVANSEPIPIGGCWVWMGSLKRNQSGMEYGRIGFRIKGEFHHEYRRQGRCWSAHVVSAIAFGGGIKMIGGVVAHICHNPVCVNPAHLIWTTQRENLLMSVRDGRIKRRARNAQAD